MDASTGTPGHGEGNPDAFHNPSASDARLSAIPPPPLIPTLPTNRQHGSPDDNSTAAPGVPSTQTRRTQRAYRSEEARAKSVYRRANPWWRRILRGLIGVGLLAGAGVLVYFGVGIVQDFLGRDRLPTAGADVPDISSASFQVTAGSPSPTIDGTLSIDLSTSAFEFVGRPTGLQEGLQVVSPDGSNTYVRTTGSDWRTATPSDAIVGALQGAIPFLRAVDGPDAVLENRLRQGSVELVDQVNEGVGDDKLRRYELELDTDNYGAKWPLQWNEYQSAVIPALGVASVVPITMTLDEDNVVVRLDAPQSNWAWERLTYSAIGISIVDPTRG